MCMSNWSRALIEAPLTEDTPNALIEMHIYILCPDPFQTHPSINHHLEFLLRLVLSRYELP